jgi:hypothetical protein
MPSAVPGSETDSVLRERRHGLNRRLSQPIVCETANPGPVTRSGGPSGAAGYSPRVQLWTMLWLPFWLIWGASSWRGVRRGRCRALLHDSPHGAV